jgi:predicted metal-dependent HD superfamily phosphohydrolase
MRDVEFIALQALKVPGDFIPLVKALYSNPLYGEGRYYHVYNHALDVLLEVVFVHMEAPWKKVREVVAAALFHDVVYVTGAKDNEARSADVAREELECYGLATALDLEYVVQLIAVTAQHFEKGARFTTEQRRFLDCDLAGLAAPWTVFCDQNTRIDQEYLESSSPLWFGITHEKLYRRRAAWFEQVLKREYIFHSERGRKRYERLARENIARILRERYDRPT